MLAAEQADVTTRSVTRLLRPPERRLVIRVAIVAALVTVICWYFGADVWHSILLASVLTTAGLVCLIGTAHDVGDTSWRSGGRADRTGSRNDVAELSWLLRGSYGRVQNAAVWRVRRIAQQRLARHHLDLVNPADRREIEELIGHRAYAILGGGDRRPPLLRSLLSSLDALEALDPTRSAALRSRSRRRAAILTPQRPRRTREP